MPNRATVFEADTMRAACHCATLVEQPDGTLLAAWFAGAYETAPDVAILAAEWQPEHARWSAARVIADTPGQSDGQPVLYAAPAGGLTLFYVAISGEDWTSAQMKRRRSGDGGRTWDTPEQLPFAPGMMFRSKAVQLTTGALLLPVYDERTWQSYMLRSTDGGATWDLGAAITTPSGNIHPCVVELSDGTLLALLRTGGAGGQIWRAASADEGRTWSAIAPTAFPNPNAGIDLLRLQDGRLLLAFNNSQTERVPLDLAWSDDEGATWSAPRTVVARPAGDQERTVNWQSYWGTAGQPVAARPPEFSYPTLLQTRDGTIHLVYTHNRTSIRHLRLDATQLDGVIPQE